MSEISKLIYYRNKQKIINSMELRKEYPLLQHFKDKFEGLIGYRLYLKIIEDMQKNNELVFRRSAGSKIYIMRI